MSPTEETLKALQVSLTTLSKEAAGIPTESHSHYKRVRTPEGEETLLTPIWQKSDIRLVTQRRKSLEEWRLSIIRAFGEGPAEFKLSPKKYVIFSGLGSTETRSQGSGIPSHIDLAPSLLASEERHLQEGHKQVLGQEDIDMTTSDERYLDARLASIEKTVEMGMSHQSKQMETLMAHLTEKVTQAVDQTRDARKELRGFGLWAVSIFVTLVVLIAGSLITMLYHSNTVERTLGNEINEVRKDVRSTADTLSKELQRINSTLQKGQSKP